MPFGAGGIFISFLILYGNICIDYFDSVWKHIFTTRGEGEHARHTSRKVATTTREEEAGLGGMKAVAIRWAEQEAARKARKRPVRLVM